MPFLFNIYINNISTNHTTRVKINDIPINNLRYANDMEILVENIQELQTPPTR